MPGAFLRSFQEGEISLYDRTAICAHTHGRFLLMTSLSRIIPRVRFCA